jgi:hypothetical protein
MQSFGPVVPLAAQAQQPRLIGVLDPPPHTLGVIHIGSRPLNTALIWSLVELFGLTPELL